MPVPPARFAGGCPRQWSTSTNVAPVISPTPRGLLASATRLYGDAMERMWGRFDPVPGERLRPLAGGERISLGGGNSRWHTHPDMRCTM